MRSHFTWNLMGKLALRRALGAGLLLLMVQVNGASGTDVGSTSITAGSLRAVRVGDFGRPLIFIPGLTGGHWVWQPTVDRLVKDHVIYVVTLAGFDGMSPASSTPFADAEAALLALIDNEKIDRPVLIGHSLGGTLAIRLAERHSERLSGIVAVDGLPVFPQSADLSAEQRAAFAERMKSTVPLDPAAFAASREAFMSTLGGVLDPTVGKRLAALTARSDPASVVAYMDDVLQADFRPELDRIKVPVLVISPYSEPDFKKWDLSEEGKTAFYESLMKGTPRIEVVSIAPARHYVMFDQPDRTLKAILSFLHSLGDLQ